MAQATPKISPGTTKRTTTCCPSGVSFMTRRWPWTRTKKEWAASPWAKTGRPLATRIAFASRSMSSCSARERPAKSGTSAMTDGSTLVMACSIPEPLRRRARLRRRHAKARETGEVFVMDQIGPGGPADIIAVSMRFGSFVPADLPRAPSPDERASHERHPAPAPLHRPGPSVLRLPALLPPRGDLRRPRHPGLGADVPRPAGARDRLFPARLACARDALRLCRGHRHRLPAHGRAELDRASAHPGNAPRGARRRLG